MATSKRSLKIATRATSGPRATHGPSNLVLIGCVAVALLWRYRDAFVLPFLNDDYVFLDATAHRSFGSLWGHQQLFFNWWRPWSREFHYWALQHTFGSRVAVFHAANAVLAITALALFHNLACLLIGPTRAALATIGCAAMAAWALPLLWVAGVQDLWMIFWSLLALSAWRVDRVLIAYAAFTLALASKETAAALPVLLFAWDALVARRPVLQAIRRAAPAVVLTIVWAIAHPHLGGRLFGHVTIESVPATAQISPMAAVLRTLLSLCSLDSVPAPHEGWGAVLLAAVPAVLFLAGGLAWVARNDRQPNSKLARQPGVLGVALVWAACGWLPLLWPTLGWHAYYGLFGALGAWLAIATTVRWNTRAAVIGVVLLATLAAARDASYSRDWGDAFYQRRAGAMLSSVRDMLKRQAPTFAPHSRVYFAGVPNNIGFLQGDGPALRVWYRDTTLRAGYLSTYRAQPAGARGEDRFFKLDAGPQLVELVLGSEDAKRALAANPNWIEDHGSLATSFIDAGDYRRGRDEYIKLADAQPQAAEPAYNVAACSEMLGDSLAALRWMNEARRRPVVSDRLREMTRAQGMRYW